MNTTAIAKAVLQMDKQLRESLPQEKLWEHTFAKHQIDKRTAGEAFTVSDHIRAMVYSMLSAGIKWDKVSNSIDITTGKITAVDTIFHDYDTEYLLQITPKELRDGIKEIGCASQSTLKQMTVLVQTNIPKLLKWQADYGSIDTFYQKFIDIDSSLKTLVIMLSYGESEYKLEQMEVALVAEYLKNIGHSIAKPDRHILRIFSSEYLGLSKQKKVSVSEAFDIVADIARQINKSVAEVDYILWSYCADGYGEICTKKKPKCDICTVRDFCNGKGEG